MNTAMVDMLVGMGGRRWQKAGRDRVYIPVALSAALVGLSVSYYNSGNVSAAMLRGNKISNGSARYMLGLMDGGYYDVPSDRFVATYDGVAEALRSQLVTRVAS